MAFLLDLLFPPFCIGCRKIGKYLCASCYQRIEFLKEQPELYRKQGAIEGSCSLIYYRGIGKMLLKHIKYSLGYAVLDYFFDNLPPDRVNLLQTSIKSANVHYIQPIPLHPLRKNIRGFNQAELIAKKLAKLTGLPVIDVLKRTKNTSPQAHISNKAERIDNIEGAFAVGLPRQIVGSNILLVDDLFTTGSTCQEAAKTLKSAGFNRIFSCTLARR